MSKRAYALERRYGSNGANMRLGEVRIGAWAFETEAVHRPDE
jgi:hypothetical protein